MDSDREGSAGQRKEVTGVVTDVLPSAMYRVKLDEGGHVVQALRARHELNRTVILYTSDNGFLWGEHRLGGKVWPFEESTHVPLIIRYPGRVPAGRRVAGFNQHKDLVPTLLDLVGVPIAF